MRALKTEDLEDRKKKVLQSVIHSYIRTAHPVGSKMLAESGVLGLSPATIRNTLAELESEGYITHPHTSAGRVPTDKGYRYYVETLVEIQRLAVEEQNRIQHECTSRVKELQEMMGTTSRILSSISHYTGFVLTPKVEYNKLTYLNLVRLSERRILVIMITDSGLIKHNVIDIDWDLSSSRLQRLSNLLNEKFVGMTLEEVQNQFIEKLKEEEKDYNELFSLASSLGKRLFSISGNELFVDGVANLLEQIEFDDVNQAKSIFKLVDEKRILSQILHKQITSKKNIKVTIGGEGMYPELKKVSMVSSVYNMHGHNVGVLGIIGPKRMEYARMISLVGYVSEIVNKVFEEFDTA